MKPQFAPRDKVRCVRAPPSKEQWIGKEGQVVEVCSDGMLVVVFETFVGPQCQFLSPAFLERIDTPKETMTTPVSTAIKTRETFTTTWSLDITLTDGKVTAVNVHPPADAEAKKPKFAVGDIVVCKTKPNLKTLPIGFIWSSQMTRLLNVPGRVSSVDKFVWVEFPGQDGAWGYPEDFLELETSEMAVATRFVFSRLDKAKA